MCCKRRQMCVCVGRRPVPIGRCAVHSGRYAVNIGRYAVCIGRHQSIPFPDAFNILLTAYSSKTFAIQCKRNKGKTDFHGPTVVAQI